MLQFNGRDAEIDWLKCTLCGHVQSVPMKRVDIPKAKCSNCERPDKLRK